MTAAYIPERGDVVWLDFYPRSGHEQTRRRPAVVLSPQAYNGTVGLALFCPITTRVKGYPFEVAVPADCSINGVVLADHLKNLDWRDRRADFICRFPAAVVNDILARLAVLLTPGHES